MTQLTDHKFTNIRRLMNSKAFVEGFTDVRKKLGFKYDRYFTDADTWAYERGRQFATLYIGPLKIGRQVSVMAEGAMTDLMRSGMIN